MIKNNLFIFDFNRTLFDPKTNRLMPGCLNVLRKIKKNKGNKILISQAMPGRIKLISKLGLIKYFTKVYITHEKSKKLMSKIINKFSARNCYVIGDRIKKEIKLGNQLGCTTIWLKLGLFSSELPADKTEQPDYIITELEQLLNILKE